MLTAIYVYQPTTLHFKTCESGLELSRMPDTATPLAEGESEKSVDKGVYKIVSSYAVDVSGTAGLYEVNPNPSIKTNGPHIPPLAAQNLGPLEVSALQAFFGITDAQKLDRV